MRTGARPDRVCRCVRQGHRQGDLGVTASRSGGAAVVNSTGERDRLM
jgi:hypothetical protein